MSMITRTVKYTNFNDQPVEATLNFFISKADMGKFAMGEAEGFKSRIEKAMAEQKPLDVWTEVEELLKRSYGVKSADGESFDKRPEVYETWQGTASYDAYAWELMSNQTELEYFISNIFPMEALDEVRAKQNAQSTVPAQARERLTDHQQKQPGRRAEVQPVQQTPVDQGTPVQSIHTDQTDDEAQQYADFQAWKNSREGQTDEQ